MEVVSNSVHRQLTLPRAVCLAGSTGVAPEDVARVATAHQAFTIITIMLIIISIILSSQSLKSIITFQYCPRGCAPGCSCTSSFTSHFHRAFTIMIIAVIVVTIIEINDYIEILGYIPFQSQLWGGDSSKSVSLTISPLPWQSWSQGPPSQGPPSSKTSSPPLIAILLTDKWRWLQTGSGHESLTPWHQLMKNASALSESLILIWLVRQVVNVKWISRRRWRGNVSRAPQYNRSLGKPDPRIEPKGRKKQIRSNILCILRVLGMSKRGLFE